MIAGLKTWVCTWPMLTRVAVGRGVRDAADADGAAGAADVLDDDGLAER